MESLKYHWQSAINIEIRLMSQTINKPSEQIDVKSQSRLRDYVVLCKPRISVMVLLTVFVGGLLSGLGAELMAIAHAAVGVLLIAASGCAANMYIERYTDFLMFRTSKRPLPSGRLSATEVALFAAITFGIGFGYMVANCHWLVAVLGLSTWILYVLVYTPMKRHSIFNTMVGAIPGAMPILIGAAAVNQGISVNAWLFFAVLLIWQFPHFMSIAWLYRKDYADGNLKMVTVTDPSGFWAGVWAIGFAVLLIPVSMMPALFLEGTLSFWLILISAILLGGWFLVASVRFANVIRKHQNGEDASRQIARKLLRVSLMYLPLYMASLVIATLI